MSHKQSHNGFTDRVFLILIILMGLLLAFNAGSMGLLVWLFIIKAALSAVLHKKPISHFIGVLLELIIGPLVVCCLIRVLLASLEGNLSSGPGSIKTALLLLLLMIISFLYVRHQILGRSKHEAKELQTNERRPILPGHWDEKEIGHHARD